MRDAAPPLEESRHPAWAVASGFVYALGVFLGPLAQRAPWPLWAITAASVVVFAWLYLDVVSGIARSTGTSWRARLDIVAMAALGFALIPVNVAAVTYVLYAAAMTPLVVSPRRALVVFALLAAIVLVEFWIVDAPNRYVLSGWVTFLVFATGASTLFVGERERQLAQLRRAHEEIEGLATIAERERIARDLHDLLGHTLSVIVLKSELASKVAQADPARAVAEIRDVERISREALSEVRAAVAGYHSHGFAGELERARHVLATSGVALAVELEPVRMPPKRESVLALVLREAVTNIVRHARASHCHVSLRGDGDGLVLTVRDNGVGGVHPGGSGLAGMHERVRAAGGRLDIDGTRGVTIEVRLPPREGAAA